LRIFAPQLRYPIDEPVRYTGEPANKRREVLHVRLEQRAQSLIVLAPDGDQYPEDCTHPLMLFAINGYPGHRADCRQQPFDRAFYRWSRPLGSHIEFTALDRRAAGRWRAHTAADPSFDLAATAQERHAREIALLIGVRRTPPTRSRCRCAWPARSVVARPGGEPPRAWDRTGHVPATASTRQRGRVGVPTPDQYCGHGPEFRGLCGGRMGVSWREGDRQLRIPRLGPSKQP